MATREGHYMKAGMLGSQFAALEELGDDEPGFAIDISPPPEQLATAIWSRIGD